MLPYLKYALYVLRHKWLVLRLSHYWGVPLWQAVIHDWTRFLPSEFIPSARYFYGPYQTALQGYRWTRGEYPAYDAARDLHERRNPHHAAYWDGRYIPAHYLHEMLCDWDAAGRVKGNPIDRWYAKNRHTVNLYPESQIYIDMLLMNKGYSLT